MKKRIKDKPTKVKSIEHYSQWRLIWLRFKKHKVAVASIFILIIIYFLGFFCEILAPYDPNSLYTNYVNAPPQRINIVDNSGKLTLPYVFQYNRGIDEETLSYIYTYNTDETAHIKLFVEGEPYKLFGLFQFKTHLFGVDEDKHMFLLGTDQLGRDMLSRLIYGGRISTTIGLVGVTISLIVGVFIGGITGYYGGVIDTFVQRVIEIIRSIPTIPLWLGLSAALPIGWSSLKVYFAIVIILSLVSWTTLARVVRSKFMSLKQEDFVLAAKIVGASDSRIIVRHMIPSFLSHIIASVSLSIPIMIIAETSLSFLGIGLRPPAVSWGVLLQDAQNIRTVAQYPWLLIPAIPVIITVLSFNFLGDGLRDAADPYGEQGRL